MQWIIDFLCNNPTIIISVLALIFTVYSFWWMNYRRGKIHVGIPRSYAAMGSEEGLLVVEFPFIFFNSGKLPLFIQNLQVVIHIDEQQLPLDFTATVDKLGKNQGRSFATQIPVRGREAILLICEFHRQPGGLLFDEGSYPIELQAILGNSMKWKRICRFSMNVSKRSAQSINKQFIVHDNKLE